MFIQFFKFVSRLFVAKHIYHNYVYLIVKKILTIDCVGVKDLNFELNI